MKIPPEGHHLVHKHGEHGDPLHVWDGRLGECVPFGSAGRLLTEDEMRERLARVKSVGQQVADSLGRVQHYLANLQTLRESEPVGYNGNPPSPWPDDFSIDTCLNHADDADTAYAELNESDLRLLVAVLTQATEET